MNIKHSVPFNITTSTARYSSFETENNLKTISNRSELILQQRWPTHE